VPRIRLPGVTGKAKNVEGISNTWQCLFDQEMLEMIVTYTNQYIESIRSNYERERNALPTDVAEMRAFIGLLYLAGMHTAGRKSLQDLWDCNVFGIEIFQLTMSEYRF
jgi:hypothetical protein